MRPGWAFALGAAAGLAAGLAPWLGGCGGGPASAPARDTVTVALPVERAEYAGATADRAAWRAWLSGYRPRLDSLAVSRPARDGCAGDSARISAWALLIHSGRSDANKPRRMTRRGFRYTPDLAVLNLVI